MNVQKTAYTKEIQDHGEFVMIPNEIFERRDLDHLAKLIWCYVTSRPPYWNSSRNNLARNLGIDRETVSKYILQLTDRNLLRVTIGMRKSWNFEIVPKSEWTLDPFSSERQCLLKVDEITCQNQMAIPPTLNTIKLKEVIKGNHLQFFKDEIEQKTQSECEPSSNSKIIDRERKFESANPEPDWLSEVNKKTIKLQEFKSEQ